MWTRIHRTVYSGYHPDISANPHDDTNELRSGCTWNLSFSRWPAGRDISHQTWIVCDSVFESSLLINISLGARQKLDRCEATSDKKQIDSCLTCAWCFMISGQVQISWIKCSQDLWGHVVPETELSLVCYRRAVPSGCDHSEGKC